MENLKYCISPLQKATLLCVAFLFFAVRVTCQATFSVRDNSALTSVYYGVLYQPDGYMTIGRGYDSLENDLILPLMVKGFDWDGELQYSKYYYTEHVSWNPNGDINTRLNDSTIVCVVIDLRDTTDTTYNTVFWIDNVGDTLRTKSFYSPFYEDDIPGTQHFVPTCIITSPDGNFIYFVSQVAEGEPSQNNFIIKKLTAEGDEVWTYVNPIDDEYYSCNTLQWFDGKLWFQVMGFYSKLKSLDVITATVVDNIELNASVFEVIQANDMWIDNEGVVTSCISFNDDFDILPAIYKMDYSGEYVWYNTPAGGVHAFMQNSEHMVSSSDGGYVSCSVKYDEIPNPEDPDNPVSNNTSEKIWLWKVDSDGVFQWQRFYEYFSFDSGYFYLNNIAHDLKATPDGGYIMAGEATASCLDWPECEQFTQQGWLLKVDGCGCLVPGCDITCTVGIEEDGRHPELVSGSLFIVGPNPASDMLNIYIPPSSISLFDIRHSTFVIYDISGNLIKSFNLKHDDTTYMIDTTGLAGGEYVLSLVSEGNVLQTERIVVAK